jgi:pimeloyl-ACP methyl ester carboxylesterase
MSKKFALKKFVVLLVTIALFITACGESPTQTPNTPTDNSPVPIGQDPAAFKEFTEQEVSWQPCDRSIFPESERATGILTALGDRLECATIKSPLSWYKPELDKVDIGILRVKARDADKRKGAILMNPGGPGGDGLEIAVLYGFLFESAKAPTPAADKLQQLSSEYDIVGFSPRGLGGSVQLFCGSNLPLPFTDFYTDRSEKNVQNILTGARLAAEACQRNPVTKYIDTEETVRDMDLIRRLLGDDKLNYLGYSYGSWLGAWYAKLFPKTTGNFVLDSNTNFSVPTLTDAFETQPESFQEGFEKIVIPYLVRNSAVFELGTSNEEVAAVYDTLPVEVKAAVTGSITGSLYNASATPDIGVLLLAAKGLSTVFQASTSPIDPNVFAQQIAAYKYAQIKEVDDAARATALALGEGVLGYLERQPTPAVLNPGDAVFVSIICNDGEWNKDPNYWIEAGNKGNEANPLSGGSVTQLPCAYWKKATTAMPAVPANIPPILMVQTEFDPATNTRGALTAFGSLPNAKMVFINDEKQHGVFPHGSECVDAAVAQYLLDGTMPSERVTNCAANPLPGETEVFPADGITPQYVGGGIITLPLKGEKTLEDQIHEIIQRNAIKPLGSN